MWTPEWSWETAAVTTDAAEHTPGAAEPTPGAPARGSIRWFPLVVGSVLLLVVLWALVTEWSGILGSHPAYLLTLVLVAVVAVGMIALALLSRPVRTVGVAGWIGRAVLVVGGVVTVGLLVYLRPMSAEAVAIDALDDGGGVTVEVSSTSIIMTPADPRSTGLVFYPGALVDPRAYAAILHPVAEAGFPVVITKPPYSLAVLGRSDADEWVGDPDDGVTSWVVGGHSLGGAMASSWAETERDELDGLLLYAAYPVNDMSGRSGLEVMSVYGTDDEIATPDEIAESAAELPASTEFVPIEGAIHAFFGDYGSQRGDGSPTVDRGAAQAEITAATIAFLESIDAA